MRGVNGSSSTEEDHEKLEDVDEASHVVKELAVDFRPWMNRAPLTVRIVTDNVRHIVVECVGVLLSYGCAGSSRNLSTASLHHFPDSWVKASVRN